MYALTREGRKPPMVQVRSSLYSVLEKRQRNRKAVNLLGFFAPLRDDSELYAMLQEIGVQHIREISRCLDMEEFQSMAEANFNLVLNQEAVPAADELSDRLGIPSIAVTRFMRRMPCAGSILRSDRLSAWILPRRALRWKVLPARRTRRSAVCRRRILR